MIYLKKWNTESAQTEYLGSANYKEPYVGLVKENNKSHYNRDSILYLSGGSVVEIHNIDRSISDTYKNSIVGVKLSNKVTSIGSYAFSGCTSLSSVTIPDSVTSIGGGAFYYCSSLSSITYDGTVRQWIKIKGSNDWFYIGSSIIEVNCTDGVVGL